MRKSRLGREEQQFDTGWPRGDREVIRRLGVAGSQAIVLGGMEGQAVGEPVRIPATSAWACTMALRDLARQSPGGWGTVPRRWPVLPSHL